MFTVAENYAELTNASEKYFKRGVILFDFTRFCNPIIYLYHSDCSKFV